MNFYGQFDPKIDSVAWDYLKDISNGHAIEVGACDGRFYSNTLAFEENGWTVLCIEPNPEYWPDLVKNRRHTQPYAISNSTGLATLTVFDIRQADHSAVTGIKPDKRLVEGYGATVVSQVQVHTRTLDASISESGIFPKLDYVSIDTEGSELDVLEGFDIERWKPSLIIVENNYDDNEIPEYMLARGYRRNRRHGVNDFYIKI